MRTLRLLALLPALLAVSGCNVVLLQPSGDVALQQRNLLLASTGLMLLIILPVMVFTLIFAWHYRASNKKAVYDPSFHHSTGLEVMIWSAPLLIIVALGALTWLGTHLLDPYRPINRIAADKPISDDMKPLTVEVVALDWKWLFFYPEQGIATVNELAAPVDVPLQFKITSGTVMNTFFVPTLAGQIAAMAGMETKLHAVINKPGVFQGFSGQYSGAGFSKMRFKFHGLAGNEFESWVAKVKADGRTLDRATFAELEKPSEGEPVRYYGSVQDGLYQAILNMCPKDGQMCMSEMMRIDAGGGGGKESTENRARLEYDNRRLQDGVEQPGATFPATSRPARGSEAPPGTQTGPGQPATPPSGAGGHEGHGPGPNAGQGSSAPSQLHP